MADESDSDETEWPIDDSYQIKCPIGLKWIIDKDVALNREKKDNISSETFKIPGFPDITYNIGIEFRIDYIDECGNVFTQLIFNFNKISCKFFVNCKGTISYKENEDKKLVINICQHTGNCLGRAEEEFRLFQCQYKKWKIPERNPFIADNKMIIEVDGYIIIEKAFGIELYISRNFYGNVFNDTMNKDFTIVAEGKELKVQKFVLKEHSTVFAQMFELNWKETSESRIEIPDVSFKTLEIAFDLLYGEQFLKLENFQYLELFIFADKYNMKELQKAVKQRMLLTPFSIVEYANLAVKYSVELFKEECQEYLITCLKSSYPIQNIETVNDEIKNAVFKEIFTAPKVAPPLQCNINICYNDHSSCI